MDEPELPPFRSLVRFSLEPHWAVGRLFGMRDYFTIPNLMMEGDRAALFSGESSETNTLENHELNDITP